MFGNVRPLTKSERLFMTRVDDQTIPLTRKVSAIGPSYEHHGGLLSLSTLMQRSRTKVLSLTSLSHWLGS